ncbi:MAG: DUF748 domain-containing protein [Bacteroidota bacterium]
MILKIFRRLTYLLVITLIALLVTLFLLISPIAEYFLERNSIVYTGRQIELDNLKINLINGVIRAENLRIYEDSSKEVFIGLNHFLVNTDIYSFISGSNRIREIALDGLNITLRQDGEKYNFDDLILRFSDSSSTTGSAGGEPVKYRLDKLGVKNSNIRYICTTPEVKAGIVSLNMDCEKIAWNNPVIEIKSDFSIESGGHTKAAFIYNLETDDFGLSLDLRKFDIRLLYPYLRNYLFVQSLDGLFSASLRIKGNAERPADISASGLLDIHDFSIIDTTAEELASIGAIHIEIDSLNSGKDIYYFGNIIVDKPFVRFAMYDDGYNFDRIMVTSESADSVSGDAPVEEYANIFRIMADYIAYFTREYQISNYKANGFRLTNGEVYYTDYTLEDKFQYHLDSLQLVSDNLNSKDDRLVVSLEAVMNTSGQMIGAMSVNPQGFSEMDIRYTIEELLLSDINPYSVYYVATPFVQGRLFFESNTNIKDQKLKSENKLRIEQISVGEKIKNSTAMNLPVKLAVSLLKDLDGNINVSIPVVGDLNDPTYKWGRALLQVLKNIVIKAAVAPYRLLAGMFGGNEEQYKEISMTFLQIKPGQGEIRNMENLVRALISKPELAIGLTQQTNTDREIEALALYKAKCDFLGYHCTDSIGLSEFSEVNSISNRDSLFNTWLENRIGQAQNLVSVQQKVISLYGRESLNAETVKMENHRSAWMVNYFVTRGIDITRVKVPDRVDQSEQSSQTGPVFKISYFIKGDEEQTGEEAYKPEN